MSQDPKHDDGGEVRVEHVLAALDQIGTLCAQLRKVVGNLHPQTVLGRAAVYTAPPGPELAGMCHPAPPDQS